MTLQLAVKRARELFDGQLAYGRTQRLDDLDLIPTKEGDDFVAFYSLAYEGTLNEEEINVAWTEVELALKNLFQMRELAAELKAASYLVAQRRPDVQALRDDRASRSRPHRVLRECTTSHR